MGNPKYFKQCNGKSCYTHNQALRQKKMVGRNRDKDVRIYFCEYCHFYHLTKKKNDIKFQDKRGMLRMQEE